MLSKRKSSQPKTTQKSTRYQKKTVQVIYSSKSISLFYTIELTLRESVVATAYKKLSESLVIPGVQLLKGQMMVLVHNRVCHSFLPITTFSERTHNAQCQFITRGGQKSNENRTRKRVILVTTKTQTYSVVLANQNVRQYAKFRPYGSHHARAKY